MLGFRRHKESPRDPENCPYAAITTLKLIARIAPPGQRKATIERVLKANGYEEKKIWGKVI